jgi:hypothetical protein
VHGEELVVGAGAQHTGIRLRELHTHHQGQRAGDEEEDERGVDVPNPDALVVDGVEEAGDPRRVFPRLFERVLDVGIGRLSRRGTLGDRHYRRLSR